MGLVQASNVPAGHAVRAPPDTRLSSEPQARTCRGREGVQWVQRWVQSWLQRQVQWRVQRRVQWRVQRRAHGGAEVGAEAGAEARTLP